MFIINNKDESIGYYYGGSWGTDHKLAKKYATKDEAELVIRKHRMVADAVEAQDTEE